VLSFAGAITLGTVLLLLPWATPEEGSMPFVDALFTATSATCVTGLIVRNTGTDFTLFGQLVILALIQVGGLGIMTFSVWLLLAVGQSLRKRHEMIMSTVLDEETVSGIVGQIKFILAMTLVMEIAGAVALFFAWRNSFENSFRAVYASVFHAISAFCNAGFSLFRTSLIGHRGNVPVNVIFCTLIVIGGVGFYVVRDLWRRARGKTSHTSPFRLQTRMVFTATVVLILAGAALFYVAERTNILAGMPWHEKGMACIFQSITARTAGFNTVDTSRYASATRTFMVVLMFIGASPGSTGGGIKTTTFWVLLHHALAGMRGRGRVEVRCRTIPADVVQKAHAIFVLAVALLLGGMFLLMVTQATGEAGFSDVLFEATSALGTVGLSTGVTANLSTAGRYVIIGLMFAGRLGPLTIGLALAGARRTPRYEYAEERVAVG